MGVKLRSSNYGFKVKGLKERRILRGIYGATGMVGTEG
jgi:hypothetical protein